MPPATADSGVQAFDRIAALRAELPGIQPGQPAGGLVLAGDLWPDDARSTLRERFATTAVADARTMVTKAVLKVSAALRGDADAVAVMTRWFGARDATPPAGSRDWWRGVESVLRIVERFLQRDIALYYRGDHDVIGAADDYPDAAPGDVLGAYDVLGFAETRVGARDNVLGLCEDFFAVATSDGGEYRGHRLNLAGRDSAGGILVHELSHNLATTEDVSVRTTLGKVVSLYGAEVCRNMAVMRPDLVWFNADNIEFFCEDVAFPGAVPS